MDGFDLIIFDCDGVLVDSEIIAAEVESRLLTEAGYPIGVEEMGERFAGMTWQNILLTIEREASIPLSASLLDKSEKLLDEVWAHATRKEHTWHHRWRVGDVLMWDNRCTMHRRDAFDPAARRVMHRTQIKGSKPS